MSTVDMSSAFMKYLADKHILPSKAMAILGITSWAEIVNWYEAHKKIEEAIK